VRTDAADFALYHGAVHFSLSVRRLHAIDTSKRADKTFELEGCPVTHGAELSLGVTEPTSDSIPTLAVELIGQSPAAVRSRELVRRLAALDSIVLLVCEVGVDALSIAREIHERSRRARGRLHVVACGGSDAAAVEQMMFGTTVYGDGDLVVVSPASEVSQARGGSLFLRDVSELSSGNQARLARMLRDGEVRLQGARVPIDVRFIASAPPSIDEDVRANRFRRDLMRRLTAARIDLPSLRERATDIPALVERVLQEVLAGSAPPRSFTHAAMALLSALTWPRNLVGLRDAITRIVAATDATVLQIEQVLPVVHVERPAPAFEPTGPLKDARMKFEREYISAVLQHHGWQLSEAARTLGIQRPNLYRKARQLGIPLGRTLTGRADRDSD
jgi:DNA-binding NtrC family response regulator